MLNIGWYRVYSFRVISSKRSEVNDPNHESLLRIEEDLADFHAIGGSTGRGNPTQQALETETDGRNCPLSYRQFEGFAFPDSAGIIWCQLCRS